MAYREGVKRFQDLKEQSKSAYSLADGRLVVRIPAQEGFNALQLYPLQLTKVDNEAIVSHYDGEVGIKATLGDTV